MYTDSKHEPVSRNVLRRAGLLGLVFASACSQGGGTRDAAPVALHFPPAHSSTTASSIRVRGELLDTDESVEFVEVRVNGQLAKTERGAFDADVALTTGTTELVVELAYPSGKQAAFTMASIENSGPDLDSPVRARFDAARERLIVLDARIGIVAVDLVTGKRSVLSSSFDNTKPVLGSPTNLVLDPLADEAYIVSQLRNVQAVSLESGARTLLADLSDGFAAPGGDITLGLDGTTLLLPSPRDAAVYAVDLFDPPVGARTLLSGDAGAKVGGEGPRFGIPIATALDPSFVRPRAFVLDARLGEVYDIDLRPGGTFAQRSVVSARGSGPDFTSFASGFGFDVAQRRLLVSDRDRIFAIDVSGGATEGERTLFSGRLSEPGAPDQRRGVGAPIERVFGLDIDPQRGRVLATDTRLRTVLSVDLATGDRTEIASRSIGSGVRLWRPEGLTIDDANRYAWIWDAGHEALLRIDLASGARTLVSGAGAGSGAEFLEPVRFVPDVERGRGYVAGVSLYEVDLASGARRIIAAPDDGRGFILDEPTAITLDRRRNRLIARSNESRGLVTVDLETLERSLLVSFDSELTAYLSDVDASEMLVDEREARLFVYDDGSRDAILAVDLTEGETLGAQTIVSSLFDQTQGVTLSAPRALTLDAETNRLFAFASKEGSLFAIDLDPATSGQRSRVTRIRSRYRIGGIALDASSGCFRVLNESLRALDVIDPVNAAAVTISK